MERRRLRWLLTVGETSDADDANEDGGSLRDCHADAAIGVEAGESHQVLFPISSRTMRHTVALSHCTPGSLSARALVQAYMP